MFGFHEHMIFEISKMRQRSKIGSGAAEVIPQLENVFYDVLPTYPVMNCVPRPFGGDEVEVLQDFQVLADVRLVAADCVGQLCGGG